jgi:hypothetical protein
MTFDGEDAEAAWYWLVRGERRQTILEALRQPLTGTQLTKKTGMNGRGVEAGLAELRVYNLVTCLNPNACRSRVYGLTDLGVAFQERLAALTGRTWMPPILAGGLDWGLYGWCCYRHRSAMLLAFDEPGQPAAIRRVAHSRDPNLRMSSNNARDVVRLLRQQGLVVPLVERKRRYPRYALTPTGAVMQHLLQGAT